MRPEKGGRDRCLGRSRGGLTTKIHALVDAQGRPIQLKLTAGQASDIASAADLMGHLVPDTMLMADKGYNANALRTLVGERGAWANIPPKSNRKDPICFSRHRYRDRNLIERFFNKIKQFRRIATRYDELAENFLASLELACVRIWRVMSRRPSPRLTLFRQAQSYSNGELLFERLPTTRLHPNCVVGSPNSNS